MVGGLCIYYSFFSSYIVGSWVLCRQQQGPHPALYTTNMSNHLDLDPGTMPFELDRMVSKVFGKEL